MEVEAQPTADVPAEGGTKAVEPSQSQMEQVAELLRGGPSEPNSKGEEDAGNVEETPKGEKTTEPPKTLHDVADRLGVGVEELYSLEFGMPDDAENTYTLGDLKDHFAERDSFGVDKLQWEEQRAEMDRENLRARNELRDLLSMLPKEALSNELISTLREKQTQTAERERAATLDVIPAWKDEQVQAADREGMIAHLERSGYPSGYLDRISDHVTIHYIRENYLREKRINEALERVKRKGSGTAKPSTGNLPRGKEGGRKPTGRTDPKVSAISNLLKGD